MKRKILTVMLVGVMSMGIMPSCVQASDSSINNIVNTKNIDIQPRLHYYTSEEVSGTSKRDYSYIINSNNFRTSKVFYSNNSSNDAYMNVYINGIKIYSDIIKPYNSGSTTFGVRYKDNIDIQVSSPRGQLNGYFSARAD